MPKTPSHSALSPEFLATVARSPGVYLMKGRQGQVLYVGKAKSLRKRLVSYLRQADKIHTKTAVLLDHVVDIETILTSTEKEALILEASLIKKHKPKYNIILRDDKNYPLIKVTVHEEWPRIVMTRKRVRDGARYFGPFSSPGSMWQTIKYIQSLFPLRSCKDRTFKFKNRPCLNYQLKRCLAPCAGKIGHSEYIEMVDNVLMVLEGRNQQLLRELRIKMNHASESLDFEKAAQFRDSITALERTFEKQQMVASSRLDQDIFSLARKGDDVAVSIIFVKKGTVCGHRSFHFQEPLGTDEEILTEIVERFYDEERAVPQEILCSHRPEDLSLLEDWLSDRRSSKVVLKVPERGRGLSLLKMATVNANQVFADLQKKEGSWQKLAQDIVKCLRLQKIPSHIVCVDISNISGMLAVGALVSYENGEKNKDAYRHYKIKHVTGPDDYSMMAETLERYFGNLHSTEELPDLLLVDGGKGQLNIARQIVQNIGLTPYVELAGLAKESDDKGEKIYRPGRKNPIILDKHSPVLLYFMSIRDEAHRFGVTFHRRLRHKRDFSSVLDEIPGVGPSRRSALLSTLGSVTRIRKASVDEIAAVAGIGPSLARQIWDNLHGER